MKTFSKCGNCSGAPWTCRVCGGKRCAHLCGRKGTDLTALCGPCKRETGKLTPPTVRKPGMDTYRAVELAEKLPASGRLVLVGPRGGKYVRTEKRGSKHYEKEG